MSLAESHWSRDDRGRWRRAARRQQRDPSRRALEASNGGEPPARAAACRSATVAERHWRHIRGSNGNGHALAAARPDLKGARDALRLLIFSGYDARTACPRPNCVWNSSALSNSMSKRRAVACVLPKDTDKICGFRIDSVNHGPSRPQLKGNGDDGWGSRCLLACEN